MRLDTPVDAMSTELWMLTHRDLRDTPRIRVFMDHLSASLATELARVRRSAAALS